MRLEANIFTNAITVSLMLFVYTAAGAYLLPEGINEVFTERTWEYFLILTVVLAASFAVFSRMCKNRAIINIGKIEKVLVHELIYILIPLTPIIQYMISNREMLTISSSILIILFFGILSFVLCVGIPVLLSFTASRHILISAGTAFLYLLLSMVSLSAKYGWHNKGSLKIQMLVFLSAFIILAFSKYLPKKIFISAVLLNLLINSFTFFYTAETVNKAQNNTGEITVGSELVNKEIKKLNDIFLFVYESYADYETVKHYGFDNKAQLEYLEEKGFNIYPGIYSLGTPSIPSISNVFNINSNVHYNREYIIGGGNVHKILKTKGYKSYGVFQNDYFFRGMGPDKIKYDYLFPAPLPLKEDKLLIKTILAGEFNDEVSLEGVGTESYVNEKQKIIKSDFQYPIIFYTHNPKPGHGPSAGVLPAEVDKYIELYINQIQQVNETVDLNYSGE